MLRVLLRLVSVSLTCLALLKHVGICFRVLFSILVLYVMSLLP